MSAGGGGLQRFEKGSAVLFIVAWIVFAILALAAWILFEGQAGIARLQAQYQADTVAQGAGVAARVYGPELRCQSNFGLEFLERLHVLNGGSDAFVCPNVGTAPVLNQGDTVSHGFATQESQGAAGQFGGLMNFAGTATRIAHSTTIHEKGGPEYIKNRTNVVLILDYSRSMLRKAQPADAATKIDRLRAIMNFVLSDLTIRLDDFPPGDPNERFVDNVDLGAVFFAGNVLDSIPIGPGETVRTQILNRVNGPVAQLGVQAEEGTNYDVAFREAAALFKARNDGDNNITIFVTDGVPTKSGDPGTFTTPFLSSKVAFDDELMGLFNGEPLVLKAFTLFVGDVNEPITNFDGVANNISEFLTAISTESGTPPQSDFEVAGLGTDIEDYFEDFEIYYTCRSGPLDPQLGNFPVQETWAWVRTPNNLPGNPLEWTDDPLQISGDFNDPRVGPDPDDAVESLYYGLFPTLDPNEPPLIWAYFSEFVCRMLEDDGKEFYIRHGWSSTIDSAIPVQPFGVAMPALP